MGYSNLGDEIDAGLIIDELNRLPGNTFFLVFFLLQLQQFVLGIQARKAVKSQQHLENMLIEEVL